MKKIRFSHMRRWMLLYLVMVLCTTAIISVLIYIGITGTLSSELSSAAVNASARKSIQPIPSMDAGLKISLLLVLTGGLLSSAGLGYAWYRISSRKLERPARILLRALELLARGQLNETVTIETDDEFGRMGAGINELAANLQELLLYVWKQTGQCLTLLEHIQSNPDLCHERRLTLESLGYLKQLTDSIDDLREMAKSYVFYDVSLDGNKAQAINQPGNASMPDQKN